MKKKLFKAKIVCDKLHLIVTIDYSDLTYEKAQKLSIVTTDTKTEKNCKLLFVINEENDLEVEDLYNLAVLFQSFIPIPLVWDIIQENNSENLDGYLIIE